MCCLVDAHQAPWFLRILWRTYSLIWTETSADLHPQKLPKNFTCLRSLCGNRWVTLRRWLMGDLVAAQPRRIKAQKCLVAASLAVSYPPALCCRVAKGSVSLSQLCNLQSPCIHSVHTCTTPLLPYTHLISPSVSFPPSFITFCRRSFPTSVCHTALVKES